jgi:hypothetical protein
LTRAGVITQFLTSRDFEPGLGIASSMQAARSTSVSKHSSRTRFGPKPQAESRYRR